MNESGCPDRKRISAYLLGTLDEAESDTIREHLNDCAACPKVVEELESVSDNLVSLLRVPVPAGAFWSEPECQRAMAEANEIGRHAAGASGGRPRTPLPDDLLETGKLGQFELVECIGQGGMGVVYKAVHTKLGRHVAVKVLSQDRMRDAHAVARFHREIKAIGNLDHGNIVRPIDAGETDGHHFLAMDLVEGYDLSALVKQLGPLPIADACEIIRQAAQALQYIDENGRVHRDIKPSNLMLDTRGDVKLLDLGLSLLNEDQTDADDDLTATGTVMGTGDYMSPEQCRHSHEVDIRSDLYSLGCTFYQLLSGRAPFADAEHASVATKVAAHIHESPPPIRDHRNDVPDELSEIVNRLLAKAPDDRYVKPSELAATLSPHTMDCDLQALVGTMEQARKTAETSASARDTDEALASAAIDTQSGEKPDLPQPAEKPRRRRWRSLTIAAAVAGILLCAILLRLKNRDGTLIVASDDADAEVVVLQGGEEVKVFNKKHGWTLSLKEGDYDVELRDKSTSLHLDKNRISIRRNGRECVTVTRSPAISTGANRRVGPTCKANSTPPIMEDIHPSPRVKTGDPMSERALVSAPAAIDRLRSWTVETVGHRGNIFAMAYSPDDGLLATAGADGSLRIWNSDTGELEQVLLGNVGVVHSLAWSPDGTSLAAAGMSNEERPTVAKAWPYAASAWVWDLNQGQLRHSFPVSCGGVTWSPDGSMLAAGDEIREARTGKLFCRLDIPVRTLAWSPDGKVIAAASRKRLIHLVAPSTGKTIEILGLPETPRNDVVQVSWSPSGKTLAMRAFAQPELHVWQFDAKTPTYSAIRNVTSVNGAAWSPNGKQLAVATSEGIAVREIATTRTTQVFAGIAGGYIAWSHDGKWLAGLGNDGRIGQWHVESGDVRSRTPLHFCDNRLSSVKWSPDGKAVAAKSPGGHLQIYQMESEHPVNTVLQRVDHPEWSPEGNAIAAVVTGGDVGLFDVTNSRLIRKFDSVARVSQIAWSPDGTRLLIIAGDSKNARIWNVASGSLLHELEGGLPGTWSPDSKFVCLQDRVFDASTGELTRNLRPYPLGTVAAWSVDGTMLATSAGMEGFRLFDTKTGQQFEWYKAARVVRGLSWAGDGKTVTAITAEGTIIDLNVGTGRVVRRRDGPPPNTPFVDISRNGTTVAANIQSTRIEFWSAATGQRQGIWVPLDDEQYLSISPEGHFLGSPRIERQIVYVAQTNKGTETLTPKQFFDEYGWKNDPAKAVFQVPGAEEGK